MYEKELNNHKESETTYNKLFLVFASGAVILFFWGLLTVTMPLVYFSFAPLIIGLLFMGKRDQHSQAIRDIEHKQRMQKMDERLNAYNSVKDTAYAAYHKVCNIIKKPEQTYSLKVFLKETPQEMASLQSEGDSWVMYVRQCECWVASKSEEHDVGALCIIETFECFNAKVARLPDFFKSDEEAFRNVWRKYISFSDILYYTIVGDVSVTSSVSGGDATYHGVSVNGIGFGEWEVDPIQIHHQEHDRRMVTLIYRDCGEESSLFFPVKMLPLLQILLPEYDHS